jgi:3,5-epimerase/4-reductase
MVGLKVDATDGVNQGTSKSIQHGPQSFLIWGGNGWIAGHLYELLKSQGKTVEKTTVRMEDREDVMEVLERVRPTHVLNCAGCTGRPNVDWCEDNREATIRSNVIGTLNLADCCFMLGIHITVFATGCKNG